MPNRVAVALRWRPEWWIASLIAAAWVVLLASDESVGHGGSAAGDALKAHDRHLEAASDHAFSVVHAGTATIASLPAWTLMSVAMMLPAALPAVRHTALNSIPRRRQWAMTLYTAVYLGAWATFGVVALAGQHLALSTSTLDGRLSLAFVLALAAGWQLTRAKRRALNSCRRTVPLPPVGLKADAGCARFALVHGWRCMKSCWAIMLVMVAVGHASPLWMVPLTALVTLEELTWLGGRLLRPSAAALALSATLVAVGV